MPRGVRGDHHKLLTPEEFDRAKKVEQVRKAMDPSYITAQEAAAIPVELRDEPRVAHQVAMSREHWPEEKAPMSVALPRDSLPTGAGETVENRPLDAASLFDSTPAQAGVGPQSAEEVEE